MKKSIFKLTMLSTVTILPLLTVAACSSSNEDSSVDKDEIKYEINLKQGPFNLGDKNQSVKEMDETKLATLIVKNHEKLFEENNVPTNFDWSHNLSLSEIMKEPKLGQIKLNLKLTNADNNNKTISANIIITGFKEEADQENIISYITFKNESGLYTIPNQSTVQVSTLDETKIKDLIIQNKDSIFNITAAANFDLSANLTVTIIEKDPTQGEIRLEVKIAKADSAGSSLTAPITLQGFLEEQDQTSDLDKAWKQATEFIEQNRSLYSGTIPALFTTDKIPTLLAKQNFGFKTEITASTNKTGDDDLNGIKTVNIKIKRNNNEEKIEAYQMKGFLTTQEYATEQSDESLKPTKYFNSDPNSTDPSKESREITVKTTKPDADISEIKTGEELMKIINLAPTSKDSSNLGGFANPFNSLLKTALATNVKLVFEDIKQLEVNGILVQGLEARVQLSNETSNKKTGFYKVKVVGFNQSQEKLQTIENLKKLALNYVTIGSPLNVDSTGYSIKQASTINTKELLIQEFNSDYLEYNGMNIEVMNVIGNSADDAKGSLKVRFRFNWKDTNLEIEQNLYIYGFKLS